MEYMYNSLIYKVNSTDDLDVLVEAVRANTLLSMTGSRGHKKVTHATKSSPSAFIPKTQAKILHALVSAKWSSTVPDHVFHKQLRDTLKISSRWINLSMKSLISDGYVYRERGPEGVSYLLNVPADNAIAYRDKLGSFYE